MSKRKTELRTRRNMTPKKWFCIHANRDEADRCMWIYDLVKGVWLKIIFDMPGKLIITGKIKKVMPLSSSVVLEPTSVLFNSKIDDDRAGNGRISLHNFQIEKIFTNDETLCEKIRSLRV